MDGWKDGRKDVKNGRLEGRKEGWMDGRMDVKDGRLEGR